MSGMHAVVCEETKTAIVWPGEKYGRAVNLGHDPTYLMIALDDGEQAIVLTEDVYIYTPSK